MPASSVKDLDKKLPFLFLLLGDRRVPHANEH